MFRRLPSLVGLRALEAAARLKSFKRAGEELSVTPTAISHRVRDLERNLGIILFERKTRGVEPTAEGEKLASAVERGFGIMSEALGELLSSVRTLRVTSTPAFISLCLAHRAAAFQERFPGTELRLESSTSRVDLRRERQIDIAIRYGAQCTRGLVVTPVANETMMALGSPQYIAGLGSKDSPVLLETEWEQSSLARVSWRTWVGYRPVKGVDPDRALRFDQEHHAMYAALAGQGLVLASSLLSRQFVARGWLIPWHPDRIVPGMSYVALTTEEKHSQARVREFLGWLTESFREDV